MQLNQIFLYLILLFSSVTQFFSPQEYVLIILTHFPSAIFIASLC